MIYQENYENQANLSSKDPLTCHRSDYVWSSLAIALEALADGLSILRDV